MDPEAQTRGLQGGALSLPMGSRTASADAEGQQQPVQQEDTPVKRVCAENRASK